MIMNKIKIAFAASRDLGLNLIEWVVNNKSESDYLIVGGIAPNYKTWWNDEVEKLYLKYNIPIYEDIDDLLDKANPDILLSINYWRVISPENIKKVPKGIVNIHHSYKLRFRGRYSTSWAIIHARIDNNWEHGTTLHYINDNLDSGNIIDTRSCPILEKDTAEILFLRVEELAKQMFKSNFARILKGVNEFILPDKKFYYYDSKSNNMEISKDLPIEEIYDRVRAWSFRDRPKPYLLYNGEKIYLSLDEK